LLVYQKVSCSENFEHKEAINLESQLKREIWIDNEILFIEKNLESGDFFQFLEENIDKWEFETEFLKDYLQCFWFLLF